jgi:hypothetical protein
MKKIAKVLVVLVFFAGVPFLFADDDYLYVIGAVEGSNLYMSYLTIGLLGDSFENGVYDAATAKEITLEVSSLTKNTRDTLNNLIESGKVTGDDRTLILEMIQAHDLLEKQAGELVKYTENKSVPNDFQFYRKQSWTMIAKILGIPQ